jgi:hypothetical protein
LIDAIGELTELVGEQAGLEDSLRALCEGPLELLVGIHQFLQLFETRLPRLPVGIDLAQIPGKFLGDLGAVAGLGFERIFCGHLWGLLEGNCRHTVTAHPQTV